MWKTMTRNETRISLILYAIGIISLFYIFSGCCKPDCKHRMCGDDGCGGSCGECTGCEGEVLPDSYCNDGFCSMICCPSCTAKCCGDDFCGGVCPDTCPEGTYCDTSRCLCEKDPVPCVNDMDCEGRGCCIDNECVWMSCAGLMCGPDPVCGLECGPCEDGKLCNENSICVPGPLGEMGEPCKYGGINEDRSYCALGFNCIGEIELGDCVDVGECTSPASYHPDCYLGKCGYSFCSVSCEVEQCPAGFVEDTSLGSCYCFPE